MNVLHKGRRRRFVVTLAATAAVTAQIAAAGYASADPAPEPVGQQGPYPVYPQLPFPVPPATPWNDHGILGRFDGHDPSFYYPAGDVVASKAPGEIIAARQMVPSFFSVIPLDVDAWQLSYRSTNTRNEPVAAVTTVMKPRGSRPDRLISYQIPQDSLAPHCAPSQTIQQATVPSNYRGSVGPDSEVLIPLYALSQGWAVSLPDHEGPANAFGAGPLAGQITLDGVRAAENFAQMSLDRGADTMVGLIGNSGGAIAAGWAAEMKEQYAPELNVVGVAEGGVPADMTAMVDLANSQLAAGLIYSGVLGVAREYPELQEYLDQHLNPLGKAMIGPQSNMCMGWNVMTMFPFLNIKGLFDSPDMVREPVPAAVLEKVRMGNNVPKMPMFIYQSNPDWIAPVGAVNRLVDDYCRNADAKVEYNRTHANEGYSLFVTAQPRVMSWMKDRFDGVPVAKGCIRNDVAGIALEGAEQEEFAAAVGPRIAALSEQAIREIK
ncbi:lipase family protein [Nocardia sp. NPDC006044]|uniref:lipase family protein n=1 Tax=Nocardia sp. NPDC006044 TaxID=3364306 RepID=UPI0036A9C9E6